MERAPMAISWRVSNMHTAQCRKSHICVSTPALSGTFLLLEPQLPLVRPMLLFQPLRLRMRVMCTWCGEVMCTWCGEVMCTWRGEVMVEQCWWSSDGRAVMVEQ